MTTPLRDALTQRINQVGPAHPDIEELVRLGEERLRRRRITAVAGTVAAVVAAIALAIGGTALNRSADQKPDPIHRPPNPDPTRTTPRPIVYSDVRYTNGSGLAGLSGEPVHVGDQVVETGSGWVNMDVTDDGVVYTAFDERAGRVWFTDGGTPEQIGSHACVAPHFAAHTVVTGNSGSLAAWFDCTPPEDRELVVYDTGTGREVVRRGIKGAGWSTRSATPTPSSVITSTSRGRTAVDTHRAASSSTSRNGSAHALRVRSRVPVRRRGQTARSRRVWAPDLGVRHRHRTAG